MWSPGTQAADNNTFGMDSNRLKKKPCNILDSILVLNLMQDSENVIRVRASLIDDTVIAIMLDSQTFARSLIW